jgi:hypothetical protein
MVPDDVQGYTKKMIDFGAGRRLPVTRPQRRLGLPMEVFSASHWRENPLLHLALLVKIYL